MTLDEHLFRRESGRMVAALTRIFGVHNLALAEDVVQDAFCRALEVWKTRGVPDNPSAWLMATARNRALDVLRRERTARTFAPELGRLVESEWTMAPLLDEGGVQVARHLIGPFITSLEMQGASVTILRLDDEKTRLWDAPVHTPALRWGV